MSLHQELHRAHKARRFGWSMSAVPDEGIDLKRPSRNVVLRDAPGSQAGLILVPGLQTTRRVAIRERAAVGSSIQVQRRKWKNPVVPANPVATTHAIIERVANYYNSCRAKIVGHCLKRYAVEPRHKAVYLAYVITGRPYSWLGYQFGGRDHTALRYAVEKTKQQTIRDFAIGSEIAALECAIRGNAK